MTLTLTIGDKIKSSWSFRPWYLLTQAEIPFTEAKIVLDRPTSRAALKQASPSGLVPILNHERNGQSHIVWDSLAIMEYVADLYPEKNLWPADPTIRAHARAVSAEIHAGFANLRTIWPMFFHRTDLAHLTAGGVSRDIARIDQIWTFCRTEFGQNGDYLFGDLSIADAMYAPVVSRFSTYGPVALSEQSRAYCDTIIASKAYQKWLEGALTEAEAEASDG